MATRVQKVRVNFTHALRRFYSDLTSVEVEASSIEDVLDRVNDLYPGLKDYLVDEHGRLRKHVNVFLDKDLISDRECLSDSLEGVREIHLMQALSGG